MSKDRYIRTKSPNGTFTDSESGITVHGHKITKLTSPVGTQTRKFLKAGGLVYATDKEVAHALKNDNVVEGDAFKTKTRIVMKDAPKGSIAAQHGMQVPVEVPLDEDDQEEDVEEENTDTPGEEDDDTDQDDENDDDGDEEDEEDGEGGLDDALAAADKPDAKKKKSDKAKRAAAIDQKVAKLL